MHNSSHSAAAPAEPGPTNGCRTNLDAAAKHHHNQNHTIVQHTPELLIVDVHRAPSKAAQAIHGVLLIVTLGGWFPVLFMYLGVTARRARRIVITPLGAQEYRLGRRFRWHPAESPHARTMRAVWLLLTVVGAILPIIVLVGATA